MPIGTVEEPERAAAVWIVLRIRLCYAMLNSRSIPETGMHNVQKA